MWPLSIANNNIMIYFYIVIFPLEYCKELQYIVMFSNISQYLFVFWLQCCILELILSKIPASASMLALATMCASTMLPVQPTALFSICSMQSYKFMQIHSLNDLQCPAPLLLWHPANVVVKLVSATVIRSERGALFIRIVQGSAFPTAYFWNIV